MIWLLKIHLAILTINCLIDLWNTTSNGQDQDSAVKMGPMLAHGQLQRCQTLCQNDDACKSGQCVLVYCSDTVSCYRFCMECFGRTECYQTGPYCAYVDLPWSRVTSAALRTGPPPFLRKRFDFSFDRSMTNMLSDTLFKKLSTLLSSLMFILKTLINSFFKFKFL